MLKVGVARREITPEGNVPLAGYTTLGGRYRQSTLDPVFVRAIALEQGDVRVVLVVFDILVITHAMAEEIQQALRSEEAGALCVATHTHSSLGGYWEPHAARLAMGPFVPGTHEALVEAGVEVAREALDDLAPARTASFTTALPDIAINRRDEEQAPDDGLWALRFARDSGDVILCGFPAHPIVAAERDLYAMSADFPGRVVNQLEETVSFAAFVNGPVGGTGTFLSDEVTDVGASLTRQAEPIAEAALGVMDQDLRDDSELRFASRTMDLPERPTPRASFDDQTLGRIFSWPLDRLATHLFGKTGITQAFVQALAVGDAVLVGTPADLGINVGRAIAEAAQRGGFPRPFVASQADGYIGYIHRREDYARRPGSGTLMMAMYENLMGIFGRDQGEVLIEEASALLEELASASRPVANQVREA